MPRKRPDRIDPTSGKRSEASQRLRGLSRELDSPLAEAHRQLKLINEGSADRDLATAAASLLRAITSAVAERRQLERHELRLAEEMSPEETHEQVLAYIEGLDRKGRAVFRARLDELDAGERVL